MPIRISSELRIVKRGEQHEYSDMDHLLACLDRGIYGHRVHDGLQSGSYDNTTMAADCYLSLGRADQCYSHVLYRSTRTEEMGVRM